MRIKKNAQVDIRSSVNCKCNYNEIEQNAANRRLKIEQDLLKARLDGGLITQERYERELEK